MFWQTELTKGCKRPSCPRQATCVKLICMSVCRWVTGMLLPAGPRSKVERDDENPWNWLLDFDIQIHHAALKVQQIVSTELLFWWFGGSGLEPGVSPAGPLIRESEAKFGTCKIWGKGASIWDCLDMDLEYAPKESEEVKMGLRASSGGALGFWANQWSVESKGFCTWSFL